MKIEFEPRRLSWIIDLSLGEVVQLSLRSSTTSWCSLIWFHCTVFKYKRVVYIWSNARLSVGVHSCPIITQEPIRPICIKLLLGKSVEPRGDKTGFSLVQQFSQFSRFNFTENHGVTRLVLAWFSSLASLVGLISRRKIVSSQSWIPKLVNNVILSCFSQKNEDAIHLVQFWFCATYGK